MVHEDLLIVFAKNAVPGKVKTRLAKDLGDEKAFEVYQHLLKLTTETVQQLNNVDVQVWFTDKLELDEWGNAKGYIQQGNDLGDKMSNAFLNGFEEGYKRVICIGTDLPDMKPDIIYSAFHELHGNQVVLGPSSDGGYYLIGMDHFHPFLFQNKPWSTDAVLDKTMEDLQGENMRFSLLEELNDIDTIEDLKDSTINYLFAGK